MVTLTSVHVMEDHTGKTIALTVQTFVSTLMSLLFNTLSRFVIAFLPRSKHLIYIYIYIYIVFKITNSF